MAIVLNEQPGRVQFSVKVVPGASRDRVMGALGDKLKIAVSKPPEDGAANRAVVQLLADVLGISRSQIQIIRGQGNPHKEIAVSSVPLAELRAKLDALLK